MVNKKTYSQKPVEVSRRWVILDASKASLGRLASCAAKYLIGKYKPTYTAHVDSGDYVVIINAEKLVVTGNKETDKKYYRHSGYVGNLKEFSLAEIKSKKPDFIIQAAIKGMLPKNKLVDGRLKRLHIFPTEEHLHEAQKPEKVEVI